MGDEASQIHLTDPHTDVALSGGETNTVELKVAAPRAPEMAERLGGMDNHRGLVDWEPPPDRDAATEDLDLERVRAYLARRFTSDRQAGRYKDLERVLIGMECAVRTNEGKVVPTNAGMLFFGYVPQEHIVQSDVACVLYRETVGASRYADRRFITGTLQDLIDGAELFLSRYIAVGARVEGFKRIDIPEYSLEALREAVINAVVHRDYTKRGEGVRVFCYPDRVEIHSPGLLLPGIHGRTDGAGRGAIEAAQSHPCEFAQGYSRLHGAPRKRHQIYARRDKTPGSARAAVSRDG